MELIKGWNWSRDGTDQGMELIKGWNYQEEKLINERNWLRDGTNQRVKLIKGCNWSRDKTDQGEELIKGWKGSRDESDQGMELIKGRNWSKDGADQRMELIKVLCNFIFRLCYVIIKKTILIKYPSIQPKRWFWKSTLGSNSVIIHRGNVLYMSQINSTILHTTIHSRSLPLTCLLNYEYSTWSPVAKTSFTSLTIPTDSV